MSVINVDLSSQGASGTASGADPSKAVVSYSANYRVTCSDPSDSPSTVLLYFAQNSGLPWMGRPMKFGNGFDFTVVCKNVTADPIEHSGGMFNVRASYEPLEGDSNQQQQQQQTGQTPEGKNTDDPVKFYDQIDITFSRFTEAAEKGVFREFINGKGNSWFSANKERAITNSAGVPFDPPLERTNCIRVVRITRNVKECNLGTYSKYKDTVNSDAFTISKSIYGFHYAIRPYNAKFTDYSTSFAIENKVKYWRETIEVQVHPRGWRRKVLDQGTMRRLYSGDTDDSGHVLGATDISAAGFVPYAPILKDGYPITSPVPLDGNGQPLKPGAEHVYLVYSVEDEIPFAGINW